MTDPTSGSETAEILADPDACRRLAAAEAELARGEVVSAEELAEAMRARTAAVDCRPDGADLQQVAEIVADAMGMGQPGRLEHEAAWRILTALAGRLAPQRRVFVAMICDRHSDPDAVVFTTADAAINHARTWAQECASDPGDVVEEPTDGWLYYARYSEDGDAVWVVERRVDVATA